MLDNLLDYGDYPEIHADSIGDVQYLQYKTRILFFEWRKVGGVFRRVTVGAISRPKEAFTDMQLAGLRSGLAMPSWHTMTPPRIALH